MNLIDLGIIIVIAISAITGFSRGFIRQTGSIVGFFISIWLAGKYYLVLAPNLKSYFLSWPQFADSFANIAAFFILYFLISTVFYIIVIILDKIFKLISIIPFVKLFNNIGGGVVGLIEGVLLVASILYVSSHFPVSKDLSQMLEKSLISPHLVKIAAIVTPFLPEEIKKTPSFFDQKNIVPILQNEVIKLEKNETTTNPNNLKTK